MAARGSVTYHCGEAYGNFHVLVLHMLSCRATHVRGSENARASEKACIRKIVDCVVDLNGQPQEDLVHTFLVACASGTSLEDTASSLSAGYAAWAAVHPRAAHTFISSVSVADFDKSFHMLRVVEALADSKTEQVGRAAAALLTEHCRKSSA